MNPMLESFNNQTGRVRQNNSIILVPKTLDRSKPFKVLWPNHLKNIPKTLSAQEKLHPGKQM